MTADPRLPGDALVAVTTGLYVAVSLYCGKTISPDPFSWLNGHGIADRKTDTGAFWLWLVLAAAFFVGSSYWTLRLLSSP